MANRAPRMRMCVACREMKQQKDMVRIVRSKENGISVDLDGHANGRGAYICQNAECIQKAQREKRLERALHTKIEGEIYDRLGEMYA